MFRDRGGGGDAEGILEGTWITAWAVVDILAARGAAEGGTKQKPAKPKPWTFVDFLLSGIILRWISTEILWKASLEDSDWAGPMFFLILGYFFFKSGILVEW